MAYDDTYPYVTAQFSTGTTGDKATITISERCKVERVFCVVEGTEATAATVKFDKRPTAGSDTGRGDGDVGVISFGASNQQGKMLYENPTTTILLDEGDQVVVEVTVASTGAKNTVAGMKVSRVAETPANNTAMVAA